MHSFGSAEQQGCFEDLCPAQREGRSWYRGSMPAVEGKEIQPLDRASSLPSHILNRALEFGQYLILDLEGCVMCPDFLSWSNKMLSCTSYSLNVFLQDSPLILGPWSF